MLCLGLALFFLLLGAGVVDLWGTMTAEQNLQAIAQDAANAGASGVNTDVYRSDNDVVLLTGTDPPPAQATARARRTPWRWSTSRPRVTYRLLSSTRRVAPTFDRPRLQRDQRRRGCYYRHVARERELTRTQGRRP